MSVESERLTKLLAKVDQLNAEDPRTVMVEGTPEPHELAYAKQLTAWVLRLNPQASEELRIAARGQHICRWMIAREQYPKTREGYLRWRDMLKAFHLQKVSELMGEAGYPQEAIERVRTLMGKRQLATDPDTQTLEDALCLLFLETELADMRRKTPAEALSDVVRKTWKKMSPRARQLAQALPLSPDDRTFVVRALGSEGRAQ